jgi:hypothetical protein
VRQQNAYNAGGMFDILMAQPGHFQALNNISGEQRIQTVTIDDPRRGRMSAQVVLTEFGALTLVRNRWVRKTDAFAFNRANFILRTMRPMTLTGLAKTDDRENYLMLGEYGFEVKGESHMAKWTGLSLVAALPASGLV